MVIELYRHHHTKLPTWTKAKYGGILNHGGAVGGTAFNPFKFLWGTPSTYGVPLMFDVGVCSMLNRKDFAVCDGAFTNSYSGVLLPAIFDRWENPDPVTYIFHVREGVLWPAVPPMNRIDRQVTAEDMAWYFDKQRAEGIMGNYFVTVDKFEALDKLTLKIVHKQPYAQWPRQLAQTGMGIVPKECYEEKGCLGSKIVSPAPFLLKENIARQRAVWERNPEFWIKGMPYMDGYLGITILDLAAQKAAFVTGKTDSFSTWLKTNKDALVKEMGGKVTVQSILCTCGVFHLRPHLDRPPFNDVRVRRALSMAMDRKTLWNLGMEGNSDLGWSIPWDELGYELPPPLENTGPYNLYNPEAAKKLMAEAGYPNGFKVEVSTFWTLGAEEMALGFQESWKKHLNVEEIFQRRDSVAINTSLAEKNWTGLILDACRTLGCSGSDADSYAQTYYSKGQGNVANINDAKMDELYLKQRGELDPVKRREILWEILRYAWDQQFTIDISLTWNYTLNQPWVLNAASHMYRWFGSTNVSGWVAMIDPDQKPK